MCAKTKNLIGKKEDKKQYVFFFNRLCIIKFNYFYIKYEKKAAILNFKSIGINVIRIKKKKSKHTI
jgi:hypothetical protein